MLREISQGELDEVRGHLIAVREHLKGIDEILFVCDTGKSKKSAKVLKQQKRKAIQLELSKSLGASFLTFSQLP